jgi:hypothetical protein
MEIGGGSRRIPHHHAWACHDTVAVRPRRCLVALASGVIHGAVSIGALVLVLRFLGAPCGPECDSGNRAAISFGLVSLGPLLYLAMLSVWLTAVAVVARVVTHEWSFRVAPALASQVMAFCAAVPVVLVPAAPAASGAAAILFVMPLVLGWICTSAAASSPG